MSETDYFSALGVDAPESEPTEDNASEAINAQDVAEPAADENTTEEEKTSDLKSKSKQRKEDAIYAKARATFEKERDAAIEKARAEADAAAAEKIAGTLKAVREQAALEKAKLAAEAEIKEISALDPEIKSIDDLRKMADYDRFRSLVVNNKLSYIDAFKLLRYEQLTTGREAGAARQAAFNAASKAHLRRSDGANDGADGEVTVTDADISRYRQFFPDMSAKEIRQYAQAYAKKTKRTE